MIKLRRRHAPLIFGCIQSAMTTGIATAIASYQSLGAADFLLGWLTSWGLAWMTMLPIVVGLAPSIQRGVNSLTVPD